MTHEAITYGNIKVGDYVQLVLLHGVHPVSHIGKIADVNRHIIILAPIKEKELPMEYNSTPNETIVPIELILEIIILQRTSNAENSKTLISKNKQRSKSTRKSK